MKIALLYDAPASLIGNRLRINRGYGTDIDALAGYFDEVIVCNPVAGFDVPEAQYELRSPNVALVPLPYFARVAESLPLLPKCARIMWQGSRSWDLVDIRLPSPLGIIGYLCARMRKIPVVLHIVGDLAAQYERRRYRGLSGPLARLAVKLSELTTHWMANHAVTITQGEALRRKYRRNGNRVVNLVRSPISSEMIVKREDTCGGPLIRLLFVGALLERKGIFTLLESAKLLVGHMDNFVVTYVGTGPLAPELARRVRDADLSGRVELKGAVYEESALLREFDQADVFVFPTYGEGFPRVIFEAMARGLPVISTCVSGIPGILQDGRDALLVSPGSPSQVADAIIAVVRDPTLRRKLIRHGREVIQEYTLERAMRKQVEVILSARSMT